MRNSSTETPVPTPASRQVRRRPMVQRKPGSVADGNAILPRVVAAGASTPFGVALKGNASPRRSSSLFARGFHADTTRLGVSAFLFDDGAAFMAASSRDAGEGR